MRQCSNMLRKLPSIVRNVSRTSRRIPSAIYYTTLNNRNQSSSFNRVRNYATIPPNELNDEQKLANLMSKLTQVPEVVEQLKKIQSIILSKNPDFSSGQVSMMDQVKILMDSEVRTHLESLGKILHESGVEISREDFQMMLRLVKDKIN